MFAVGVPQSGNAPAPVAKKDEKKDGTELSVSRIAADDPAQAGLRLPQEPRRRTLDPEEEIRRNIHGYKTEFLIATVPDPIDSAYGYAFDQVVDAIQRAVEKKDGYILDRSWLPWELDRKAKPKPGDPPSNYARPSRASSCSATARTRAGRSITRACASCFWSARRRWAGIHKQAFYQRSDAS